MKKKFFFALATALLVSGSMMAQNTVEVDIDGEVTGYVTLEAAVAAAQTAGKGTITFLANYDRYPQAWVTDCAIAFPDSLGFAENKKSLYTFHAFNPANGDEVIGENKAAGKLSDAADIARFSEILQEVDPTFDPAGKDIANLSMKSLNGYADWHADFEVFFDTDIAAKDYTIAGNYGDYGWIAKDQQGQTLSADMKAYEPLRLVKAIDQNLKYWELLDKVRTFHCGIISLNDSLNAGKTYFVNLYLYSEGNEDIKILVKSVRFAFPSIINEQYDVQVNPAAIEGKNEEEVAAIEKLMNNNFASENNNVDEATAGYGEENDKYIEVKLEAAEVTVAQEVSVVSSSIFDVKPMMAIISGQDTTYAIIPNSEIKSAINFRLPVDIALIGEDVTVSHKGAEDLSFSKVGDYEVQSIVREDGTISGAFVALSASKFSLYKVEPKNTPTAMVEVKAAENVKKMMVNGQLVIVKDGKKYNAQGVEL